MEASKLIEVIARGEDSFTQMKQSQDIHNAQSLAGELVAFSNSKGGILIIGVADNGEIKGLSSEDTRRLNQLLSNTATDLVRPSINLETKNILVEGKTVLVATISAGISKPYSDNNGVFWVKNGADKRRVTSREEIQRMFQGGGLVHADEVPVSGSSIADIDIDHFRLFFEEQYGEPLEMPMKPLGQLFGNLGLTKETELTLAGLLLFGKNPQRFHPALVVKAVSFAGNDPAGTKYRDSQDINGNLKEMFTGTMSFLLRNLRHLQGDKSFNSVGDPEVPRGALEELVVNMLIHRDYFISAPWRVLMFDNRVELISPGSLPNDLTVENIRSGISNMRNPFIASIATRELPYRGIGTGIRRAAQSIHGLQLESDREKNLFTAIIPRAENLQ